MRPSGTCSQCGRSVPAEGKFCPNCGARATRSIACPRCGAEIGADDRFCATCGCKLSDNQGKVSSIAASHFHLEMPELHLPRLIYPGNKLPGAPDSGPAAGGLDHEFAADPVAAGVQGVKASMALAVDRPSRIYIPGDTVRVTLRVENEKDLRIRQARLALLCIEEYQYRHSEFDPNLNTYDTREDWCTVADMVGSVVFLEAMTIPAGFRRTFEYDFAIPKESTPTIAGGFILSCRWLLRATLDRKPAFDVNEETAITVLSLAPGLADGPGEHGTSDMPEFAKISLSLPSREWVLGEAVQGRLLVCPQKDFDVSEVRVELAHTEYVPRDEGHKRVGWREVQVSDKSHFRAGVTQVFPFKVQLDPDDPITSHTDHGSITWSLRGVLARPWAFDPHVQEEIFVYSGRKGVCGRQSV